jgi:hypothetical protein
LEGVVHQLQVEVRWEMSVFKVVLAPQPAVVRARSGFAAITSESTLKLQVWFEDAFALITQGFSRQLADILVALLTPSAVIALVMALWRVAADLGWAGAFLITDGFFSHWQVWIALSIGLKLISSTMIAWGSRTSKFSEEN